MRAKHVALMEALMGQTDWVTARQLSLQLHISERSVKNYITEVNYFEHDLITASRKGYVIDKDRAQLLLVHQSRSLPESPAERVNYIITELLTGDSQGASSLDLYELAERIFISYETLKKDMIKVRSKLKEYGLYINAANSVVTLEGKELHKRKLLSQILYEEFNKNVLSLDVVQKAFPDYDLEVLRDILLTECKKYHYFIHDYALLNLILDVVITMDRIRKDCTFLAHIGKKYRYGVRERELSEQIACRIEETYGISFTEWEIQELTTLLISHLMKVDFGVLDRETVKGLVEPECLILVHEIMIYLNENYFIDTEDEAFVIKFTIHISNLLRRLENHYATKNPLTGHIKNSCPLIFECAVGVANRLQQMTGYKVDEDEIAYIALHIGGNLETYEKQKDKLGCILLFMQYYDMSDIMLDKLQNEFKDELVIRNMVTAPFKEEMLKKEDIIISTVGVDSAKWHHMVQVNPFLTERDIQAIWKKIREIKGEKKKQRLKELLLQITTPALFCRNTQIQSQREALELMIGTMVKLGYVEPEYISEVEEREQHSSTAFGRLAVPHSLNLNAHKTGMYILLSDKPVAWGEYMVNVILLFAINREDRTLFHEVFDNLIVLLLEYVNLERVLQSPDYESFIEAILSCH